VISTAPIDDLPDDPDFAAEWDRASHKMSWLAHSLGSIGRCVMEDHGTPASVMRGILDGWVIMSGAPV
jgi:hypothetical protein